MKRLLVSKSLVAIALGLGALAPVWAADAGDFFRAIHQDNDYAMRRLLEDGFDPNTKSDKGVPGLYMALQEGSMKVAKVLLQSRRLKAEQRNATDESPLMMAALKGQLDVAQALIDKDADVNKTGWTPLHYAASGTTQDAKAMVALLLEENAYIDAASPNGTTPLMMAVRYGPGDVARLLVQEGADPTLKNELGLTALDFARQADRADMVELIAQAVRRRQPSAGKW